MDGVTRAPGEVAREVFSEIRYVRHLLLHALSILAAAAAEDRRRWGFIDPSWNLIGVYTQGQLLPRNIELTRPPRRGLQRPDPAVTVPIIGVHTDAQQSRCRRARQRADER
ncbi:hypothetical protein EEB14_33270 [Rhodococcus sp. WS4]|nr:hypothetical protein EEB14_33270 [Rhodococcus sp. WS4]